MEQVEKHRPFGVTLIGRNDHNRWDSISCKWNYSSNSNPISIGYSDHLALVGLSSGTGAAFLALGLAILLWLMDY